MYGKSNKSDYTKEAIQSESRTKLFFDILGVKYGQLVKINLVLVVCLLPVIVWSWMNFNATLELTSVERAFYRIIYSAGLIPCLCLLAAPLAGITYLIKNFTQDKHVWLWKDFVQHTKSNAKQAILFMLVYSLALSIGQIILYLYTLIMDANPATAIFRGIYLVLYILISLSAIYAFPMMVTYELKLKDIIRNSLLLTIGSLNTTILAPILALLPVILLIGLSMVWTYGIAILLLYLLVFGFAFGLYINISFTTSVFAKHMDTANDNQEESEQDNIDN